MSAHERGSGTIYVLGLMAVVAILGLTGVALGAALTARHRALAAADLGAISAAAYAFEGSTAACEKAVRAVAAQGGRLTSCLITGPIAAVTVQVNLPGPLAHLGPATGRARAGPAAGPATHP